METTAHIILSKREHDIVIMVYVFGGCSTAHVAKRHFGQLKSTRVCYRCLAKLVREGFLDSRRLPSTTGLGSGRLFLTVGRRGKAVVAQALGKSTSDLPRSRIDAPRFIDHHLAICDTRVNAELAVDRSEGFALVEWTRDRQVTVKVPRNDAPGDSTLIPDGAFTLSLPDGRRQRFFLEQDTGSMSSSKRMRERLHAYLLASVVVPDPVLFVMTSEARLAAIANLAIEEAEQMGCNPTSIWLTTNKQLTKDSFVDGRIWDVIGLSSAVSIADLAVSRWSETDGVNGVFGVYRASARSADVGLPTHSARTGGHTL